MVSLESLREDKDKVNYMARAVINAVKEPKKCPVCGYPELWFKQYSLSLNDKEQKVSVLYKCGRCAYVNTTNPIVVTVSDIPVTLLMCSYESAVTSPVLIKLSGEVIEYSKVRGNLIGHDFWNIPDIKLPNIRCYCGAELEITNFNPFYRGKIFGDDHYRCDIHCKCKNGHTLAFGVHITKDEYERLLEVKHEKQKK